MTEANKTVHKPVAWQRRLFRWAFYVCLAIVGLLVGAELFARFYLHMGNPPLSMADADIEYMFKPNQTVNRFGNIIHYNQWSMKSDDFQKTKSSSNEFRVMVIGDSVINGGAQTPNDMTATAIVQRELSKTRNQPVVVGNISAGSWGPPNQLAYLKRFGLFDADVVVLVLSSHDYADAPTFEPTVGVNTDFPEHRPMFALWEAVTRYLPRYLPVFGGPSGDPMAAPLPSQKDILWCQQSIRDMAKLAQEKGADFIVIQHLEQAELDQTETSGHRQNRLTLDALGIVVIDPAQDYQAAQKSGESIYRDNIHLNLAGQRVLASIIENALLTRERSPLLH